MKNLGEAPAAMHVKKGHQQLWQWLTRNDPATTIANGTATSPQEVKLWFEVGYLL